MTINQDTLYLIELIIKIIRKKTQHRTLHYSDPLSLADKHSPDTYVMVVEANCSTLVPWDGRILRWRPPIAPTSGPSTPESPRTASNGGALRQSHVEPRVTSVGHVEPCRLARCCLTPEPPCLTHHHSARLASPRLTPLPDVLIVGRRLPCLEERLREPYTSVWRDNEEGKKGKTTKRKRERIKKKRIGKEKKKRNKKREQGKRKK
jgi:hypothetical protein